MSPKRGSGNIGALSQAPDSRAYSLKRHMTSPPGAAHIHCWCFVFLTTLAQMEFAKYLKAVP